MDKIKITSKRVFGLDLMRSIAISFVIFGHGWFLFSGLSSQLDLLKSIFILGVEIFFVLSGFLIGGILLRDFKESCDIKTIVHFWKRRWYRTLPNYYLFLVINIIGFSIFDPKFIWKWGYLFFLQNFAWKPYSFFSVSWSLAIEEWFYFLLPITVLIFSFISSTFKRGVAYTVALFIISIIALRLYVSLNFGFLWNEELRLTTIFRLDSLMYGVLAAWVYHYYRNIFLLKKSLKLAIGLLIIGSTIFLRNENIVSTNAYASALYFPLSSMGIMFFLPVFSQWRADDSNFIVRCITNISIWSYSIYLVHIPILEVVMIAGKTLPLLYQEPYCYVVFVAWVSVVLYLSYLIYTFYEKPITELRDIVLFK